ncbi:hypothetical protein [Neorhodopirellula lusitana]|uniref:hypothetical protein n=1 Tax=Neorhodopirellula lusitana TaxID=445327 RepID=UPI00384F254C
MMTKLTPILMCCCAFVLWKASIVVCAADIEEADLGAFHRPKDEPGRKAFGPSRKPFLAEIEKTETFEKWKVFEDERIRFEYPVHEAISLEVQEKGPISIGGAPVSSVDASFSKAYLLTAKGETLLVLLSAQADWLDDGICFCGAIAYDRYLIRNGNLYRFSFLNDGVLKNMQVLGAGERIMMFEWTHLPIHPAVYRRIARSIKLKRPGPWTAASCQKRVLERYGPRAAVGWLDEGTSTDTAEALLGRPTRVFVSGTYVWEYPKSEDGYRWTERLALPFTNGKLVRFDSRFFDSGLGHQQAIEGGIPWMIQAARPYEEPAERGAKAKKMPEALQKQLLELFLENADKDSGDFDEACEVMEILIEQGVRDGRALDLVRKRFQSEGGHRAAWVLHEAGQQEDVSLFVEKIRERYQRTEKERGGGFLFDDLHNWLAFVPKDDDRYPDLIRDGLSSPDEDVRESVFYFLDTAPLPKQERVKFVRAGLQDSSAEVRYRAASYFTKDKMSPQDWDLLQNAASKEKNEDTLTRMREVLKEHEMPKKRTKVFSPIRD